MANAVHQTAVRNDPLGCAVKDIFLWEPESYFQSIWLEAANIDGWYVAIPWILLATKAKNHIETWSTQIVLN